VKEFYAIHVLHCIKHLETIKKKMNFDLSDEEISLIKKALEVQYKAHRDKFIESYQVGNI
jgi:hypothetical protein